MQPFLSDSALSGLGAVSDEDSALSALPMYSQWMYFCPFQPLSGPNLDKLLIDWYHDYQVADMEFAVSHHFVGERGGYVVVCAL